jgi:hypothetical protein
LNNIQAINLNRFSTLLLDNLNYLYPQENINLISRSNGYYLSQFKIKNPHLRANNKDAYISYLNFNYISNDLITNDSSTTDYIIYYK